MIENKNLCEEYVDSILEGKEELKERTDNTLYVQFADGILTPQIPYISAFGLKIKNWEYEKYSKKEKLVYKTVLVYNNKINDLCSKLEDEIEKLMKQCANDLENLK